MHVERTLKDGTTEVAYPYSAIPDDLGTLFAASRSVPQDQVKDILYAAFVTACQADGYKRGKSAMSLPVGTILDLM
jgi:hypothetical protein